MLTEVHITRRMTGKMEGFTSINTSPKDNEFCNAMFKGQRNSVCEECYSHKTMARYKNADAAFSRNGALLNDKMLDAWQVPKFKPQSVVRFDAHGELKGGVHCANLFLICRSNPDVTFTLWTKRVDIVQKVIRDFGKPHNLILIRSSIDLNKADSLPQNFDKVFTVYDKSHKGEEFINCGALKCKDCMTCYTIGNTTQQIHEVLK